MNNLQKHYDAIYASDKNAFGQGEPAMLVKELLSFKRSGKVLDVGAGQGRNSLFLAGKGFLVTSTDISEVALEQIESIATSNNLKVQTKKIDIRMIPATDFSLYDIVLCLFVFHHLSKKDALQAIRSAQKVAAKGVTHVISTMTSEGDFYKNIDKNKDLFYPNPNELKELYENVGWKILSYREKITPARQKRSDGTPMHNLTAFLIAEKT